MTYKMSKLLNFTSTTEDESTYQGLGIARNHNQNARDYFNKTKIEEGEHPKADKLEDLDEEITKQ